MSEAVTQELPTVWSDEVAALFAFEDASAPPGAESAYALWAAKTGRFRPPRNPTKEAWSNRFRRVVAETAAKDQKLNWAPGEKVALKSGLGHRSLGTATTAAGENLPVLARLVEGEEWETIWSASKEPPQGAFVEALAAMLACGSKRALLAALVDGERLRTWLIDSEPDVMKLIERQVRWFLDKHVLRDVPPPADPTKDGDAIRSALAHAEAGKELDLSADPEAAALIRQWLDAEPVAKKEAERLEQAKAGLLLKLGTAQRAIIGRTILSSHTVAATQVSYERRAYRVLKITQGAKDASGKQPGSSPGRKG